MDNKAYWSYGGGALPVPLSNEEHQKLFAQRENPEWKDIRNTIITHNIRIVIHIAHKFKNTGIEMDDLVSIGTIGLIKAADTFNHNRLTKFSTYAVSCIRNEILMYIRKKTHEIAATSLDEPINEDSEGNQLVLSDTLYAEDVIDKRLEDAGNRQVLESAFSKLTPREKNLIDLRFGLSNGGEGNGNCVNLLKLPKPRHRG